MKKIRLDCPDFETIKKTISSDVDVLEIVFNDKDTKINGLIIIGFLVDAGYNLSSVKPTDETEVNHLAIFQKKN